MCLSCCGAFWVVLGRFLGVSVRILQHSSPPIASAGPPHPPTTLPHPSAPSATPFHLDSRPLLLDFHSLSQSAIYPSIYLHLVNSVVSGSPVNPSATPLAPIQCIQASADSVLRPLSLPFDLGPFPHFRAAFADLSRR